MIRTVIPIAPTLAKPFHRPGWVFEEKYDGWRMIAYKDGSVVRLISRNNVDHTERFRETHRGAGSEIPSTVAALESPASDLRRRCLSVNRQEDRT